MGFGICLTIPSNYSSIVVRILGYLGCSLRIQYKSWCLDPFHWVLYTWVAGWVIITKLKLVASGSAEISAQPYSAVVRLEHSLFVHSHLIGMFAQNQLNLAKWSIKLFWYKVHVIFLCINKVKGTTWFYSGVYLAYPFFILNLGVTASLGIEIMKSLSFTGREGFEWGGEEVYFFSIILLRDRSLFLPEGGW